MALSLSSCLSQSKLLERRRERKSGSGDALAAAVKKSKVAVGLMSPRESMCMDRRAVPTSFAAAFFHTCLSVGTVTTVGSYATYDRSGPHATGVTVPSHGG